MATVTIDGFEIDAAVTEDHAFDSEVTEHPVEIGADVADNIRARPIVVTLEGIVSDTPIGAIASRRGDRNAAGDLAFAPSDDALAHLLAIRDAREPITIQTSLRVFENMVLQSLSVPRSATTGAALRFSATFKQVRLVTNQRTTVRVSVPAGAKKVNRGNKPALDTKDSAHPNGATPPAPKTDSWLGRLIGR